MDTKLKKYEGQVIDNFTFNRNVLVLNFASGDKLELYARGDCCSESWFEQIAGEEALVKGSTLRTIELIDLDKVMEIDCITVIQHYGVKFMTDNGYADVDMRNSSNGYYGGYISINDNSQYSSNLLDPVDPKLL